MARGFWHDLGRLAITRALVLVLALPVLLGPSLPFFARLAAGPHVHVCHCDVHHTDCACPICFPDRDDLKKNELAVSAPCGDEPGEHVVFSTAVVPAVLTAPSVVFPPPVARITPRAPAALLSRGPSPPEPPPPRA